MHKNLDFRGDALRLVLRNHSAGENFTLREGLFLQLSSL